MQHHHVALLLSTTTVLVCCCCCSSAGSSTHGGTSFMIVGRLPVGDENVIGFCDHGQILICSLGCFGSPD